MVKTSTVPMVAWVSLDSNRHTELAALASSRSVVLGFSVTTQLCFMVPPEGVLVMPSAVAGATIPAREELLPPD